MTRNKKGKTGGKGRNTPKKSQQSPKAPLAKSNLAHASQPSSDHPGSLFTLRDAARNSDHKTTFWSSDTNLRSKGMTFVKSTIGAGDAIDPQNQSPDIAQQEKSPELNGQQFPTFDGVLDALHNHAIRDVEPRPLYNVPVREPLGAIIQSTNSGHASPLGKPSSRSSSISSEEIVLFKGRQNKTTKDFDDYFPPSKTQIPGSTHQGDSTKNRMQHRTATIKSDAHATTPTEHAAPAIETDDSWKSGFSVQTSKAELTPRNGLERLNDGTKVSVSASQTAQHQSEQSDEGFLPVANVRGHQGRSERASRVPGINPIGVINSSGSEAMSEAILDDYVSNMKASGTIETTWEARDRQAPDAWQKTFEEDELEVENEEWESAESEGLEREGRDRDGDVMDGEDHDDTSDDDEAFNDEEDLIQRRMDSMSDEHIARLLAKQEELGLGSDQLVLFDADEQSEMDNYDSYKAMEFATPSGLGPRKKSRREQKKKWADRAAFDVDLMDGDDYGDFDVMDWTRASLKAKPKSLEDIAAFGLSDSELEEELREVWTADRKKKREKKREREEMRAQGLLGKKGERKPNLGLKYQGGMSMAAIREELENFLDSDNTTLSLPPMDKKDRKIVHEIASQFKLKSKSIGSGAKRFPVLYKTARTRDFEDATFNRVERTINRRFFPRMDRSNRPSGRLANGGGSGFGATFSYRDGETVGAGASEIGSDNRGRAILERMGWSKGTALGALDNKGILVPVEHIVKKSRAGLG